MKKSKILNDILPFVKIIHHSSGRLRLDVSSKIKELDNLDEINLDDVFNIKGILDLKVNKLLGKITILYDDKLLAMSSFENLLNSKNEDEIKLALKEFNIED